MEEQTYRHGLIDTDILVDARRGLIDAADFLDSMLSGDGVHISAITAMELIAGCRNSSELNSIKQVLTDFTIHPLTPEISRQAQALMESFTLGHGLELPDALIAASAIVCPLPLYTRNVRHYRMIPELLLIQPY